MKAKVLTRKTKRSWRGIQLSGWKVIVLAAIVLASAAWAFTEFRENGGSLRIARKKAPRPEDVPAITETTQMERRVIERLNGARTEVLADLSSAKAWGSYGIILDAHEMYDGAVTAYRIAAELDPNDFRWPYFLSRVIKFQEGDDSPKIVGLYESAAKLRPDYAPLQVRYGDSLLRLNRLGEARKAYEKALELKPAMWIAHRGLGQALIQTGDASEAVAHLQSAVSLRPDDGVSQAALARAYLLAGQKERADSAASKSRGLKQVHIFEDPVMAEIGTAGISSSTCFKRAKELIALGRFQEALQNLQITAEVLKDHPAVLLSMGTCYQGLGQPEQAIQLYEKSLAVEDEVPNLHIQVGSLLAEAGEFPRAISHYRRAVALKDSPSNRAYLATGLVQSGDIPEALAEFDRAEKVGQLDANAHNNWGTALARVGRYKEAIPHFREAALLEPQSANAYFNWGRALEDLGNPGEAIRLFQIAARFDPQSPAVRRIHELTANP